MHISYAATLDLAAGTIPDAAEVARSWLASLQLGGVDLAADGESKLRNMDARWRVEGREALEVDLVERGSGGTVTQTSLHLAGAAQGSCGRHQVTADAVGVACPAEARGGTRHRSAVAASDGCDGRRAGRPS